MAALIEVNGLKKYFPITKGFFKSSVGYYKAVDDVSFTINRSETFGLVGESGCGKTTVGKSILRLIEPTAGSIVFEGQDIGRMNVKELRGKRKDMQIIFQDPYSSLNPLMTVEQLISEPLKLHKLASGSACRERVIEILEIVGLNRMEMKKYPHEFSGGQRQRIMIARALSVNPKLIVCDEPVSALDVSIQAQILNLMKKLQQDLGVAYLFIAHGMPVVQHISQRVGVMYLGKLVEVTDNESIFNNCLHPYTVALMSAIPVPDPFNRKRHIQINGEVPNLMNPPAGCLLSSRCPKCMAKCKEIAPELREVAPGHQVACHLI
ncbi:MAG: ABC transporter ATP-binding protein [Negativicutes bacterium]